MWKNLNAFLSVKNDVFSEKQFQAPSKTVPVFNWVWNGPLTHEETEKQLDEMERLGIKAVCIIPEPKSFRPNSIPTLLEPDYLTPPYFEEYKYAVSVAKKKGMLMWLYDEGGWPSGSACGKVMINHPDYLRQKLGVRTENYSKGDVYIAKEDVLEAFLGDEMIQSGHVFEDECSVNEYFIDSFRFNNPGVPEVPDLTRKEATDAFLELTHEGYKPYLNEDFGDTIVAVFSDEPIAPRKVPFRKEIEEIFEKENGYSIRPFLPELMGSKVATDEGAKARIAWFDLCGRLFRDNYLMLEKKWSNEHNMAFIGHMDVDHTAYLNCLNSGCFGIMRALRCFDMPGVDVIWRQIFPYRTENPFIVQRGSGNGIFPRYASSAASQIGERYSITESMGVYGAGATFDQMRYVINYQAVRGINVYNIFGIPYHREGFLMMGELPYFTEKHACYKDLGEANKYLERISYLTSLGESENPVALYMPVCDLWSGQTDEQAGFAFEKAGDELEDARIPFDIADDEVFVKADEKSIKCGKIVMGNACYNTIVVPPCKFMPKETIQALETFIAGGGVVFAISGDYMPEIKGAQIVNDAKDILKAPLSLTGDTEKIRLGVRKAENGKMYLLFNEANERKTFNVDAKGGFYILDAKNGNIIEPLFTDAGLSVTLEIGEMLILWQGDAIKSKQQALYNNELILDGEYTFRKSDRFVIGEMSFSLEEINEEEKPIALGDWSNIVGVDFSGSGVYKTNFKAPKNEGVICLDLGDVRYSCEAFLNGKSLGVRTMSPFTYEINAIDLDDDNTLEVRVTNTGANEYYYTKSFDKWQPWQLTTYAKTQNLFHKDSLSGGLCGPVKIKF